MKSRKNKGRKKGRRQESKEEKKEGRKKGREEERKERRKELMKEGKKEETMELFLPYPLVKLNVHKSGPKLDLFYFSTNSICIGSFVNMNMVNESRKKCMCN